MMGVAGGTGPTPHRKTHVSVSSSTNMATVAPSSTASVYRRNAWAEEEGHDKHYMNTATSNQYQ